MYVSRFRDFRSRAARTYALDRGTSVLFQPVFARDRPKINVDYYFKVLIVTLSAIPGNRKSQGRGKGSVHRFIS